MKKWRELSDKQREFIIVGTATLGVVALSCFGAYCFYKGAGNGYSCGYYNGFAQGGLETANFLSREILNHKLSHNDYSPERFHIEHKINVPGCEGIYTRDISITPSIKE